MGNKFKYKVSGISSINNKILVHYITGIIFLFIAFPTFADSTDVTKIQTFIQNIIQVLVTLAGLLATGFFVWGGVGYITSSGNPEHLDKSKKTILYSAVGLAVVLGAFVLSNIIAQLAGTAFGSATTTH